MAKADSAGVCSLSLEGRKQGLGGGSGGGDGETLNWACFLGADHRHMRKDGNPW